MYHCSYNRLIVPPNGTRVRRSSQFNSFDGESYVMSVPGHPIPLRASVATTSPARIARLLLVAYRTRHQPLARQDIGQIGRNVRVYLSPKCNRDIIVEERNIVNETGRRARNNGETQCITRTVYSNCLCSVEQVEMALRDMCRVENLVESGQLPFAAISSGCEKCDLDAEEETPICIPCKPKIGERFAPATPNTVLTEDEIEKIISWYETGVSFRPPSD